MATRIFKASDDNSLRGEHLITQINPILPTPMDSVHACLQLSRDDLVSVLLFAAGGTSCVCSPGTGKDECVSGCKKSHSSVV
jgi:hypothetical protein